MTSSPRRIRTVVGWTCTSLGWLIIGLCLLGWIANDRWWWSQWLSWIPVLAFVLVGILMWSGRHIRRTPGVSNWSGVGWVIAGLVFSAVDHLLLGGYWFSGPPPTAETVRILQWNAGPTPSNVTPFTSFIVQTDADITVVEGARRTTSDPLFQTWAEDKSLAMRGQFLIASKLPITRLQTVAWTHDILLIELSVKQRNGQSLDLLIVDLPSDPNRSRNTIIEEVAQVRSRLHREPHIAIGDFNLTQYSWQLERVLPGFFPMWRDAGLGWNGTWPRRLPIYRLDHVLSKRPTRVHLITTTDPGCGRHRAQVIDIRAVTTD
ncbi:MAG: hypothetical protein HOL13_07610 [Phycisphaerae bacterium]|nr:hypothetical protein [Phycisphaerae bacterium]